MAAAENEAAPDALVLGLMTPSSTPATTHASVASLAVTPDPAEVAAVVAAASAAVVTSPSARRRVASTHTGPVLPSTPWIQEFADARAQAAADASAAADSASDASSARTPIHAADQADVQADFGATAPAPAILYVLADLAATAEI
ncbi:unnamed protein product [Phytophthora fragariaefolia]|uniref:Unnamed protein product n=1 Tax=Phytophthora fragariaefolia TaxID=1490495 RepID=A0A9W6YFH3_9STRA|nr:unnamed protein product [Phytophthora fragariaefolia]